MTPLLDIRGVTVGYNGRMVLDGLSLAVGKGETVALVGRNGAGKSTLLRSIAGLIEPAAGTMLLEGTSLQGLTVRTRIRLGISFVAQSRECFPELTVVENLDVAMACLALRKDEREARRQEVLSTLPELAQVQRRIVAVLSGGEQQMVVLAMALCQRPRIVLLDEPSLGLGHAVVSALTGALQHYVAAGGAVLLVEQKLQVVSALAESLAYLEHGTIVMRGPTTALLDDPLFVERYLGVSGEKDHGDSKDR